MHLNRRPSKQSALIILIKIIILSIHIYLFFFFYEWQFSSTKTNFFLIHEKSQIADSQFNFHYITWHLQPLSLLRKKEYTWEHIYLVYLRAFTLTVEKKEHF